MSRRRRGLGSAPAEHQTRAQRADSNAHDAAEHVIKEAAGGHCTGALFQLTGAYVNLGQRDAELRGAGHGPLTMDKTALMVERAKAAFRQHCVVPRR